MENFQRRNRVIHGSQQSKLTLVKFEMKIKHLIMLVYPYLRHKEEVISLSQEATMFREQPKQHRIFSQLTASLPSSFFING